MTVAREAAEFVEVLSHPTTKAREAAEFVEVLSHPTTKAREAAEFVEVLVSIHPPGPARALRAYPRDDILGRVPTPRHPKFSRSQQYGARRGPTAYK